MKIVSVDPGKRHLGLAIYENGALTHFDSYDLYDYVPKRKSDFDNISMKYPGLKPQIKRGISLAIDGKIYKESWFTPITEDSEVVLMPYMQGG